MALQRTRLPLTLAGAVVLTAGLVHPQAQAADGSYVALGDSYSAGVGTKAKVDDCYRSQHGYPALIAGQKGLQLDYQACSGATTSDVTNNQLGALSSATTHVSMTIGGNDLGFGDTLTTCAQPGWVSDCQKKIDAGQQVLTGQLPGRYDSLFDSIRSKAPNAKVVVGGYPHIFMGEDCNALTFFSPDEQQKINSATDDLDVLIGGKAQARGFGYVDPRGAFKGHAVCDSPEWVNGLSNPVEESYHPNRDGNQGYAALFGPALTGQGYTAKMRPHSDRPMRSTARQRGDRVLSMQLTSPTNLAKARAGGVDTGRLQRLNAQLRSSDPTVVDGALRQLRAMDADYERTH